MIFGYGRLKKDSTAITRALKAQVRHGVRSVEAETLVVQRECTSLEQRLKEAGAELVRIDVVTSECRTQVVFEAIKALLNPGDTLIFNEIMDLGGSGHEVWNTMNELTALGVHFRDISQRLDSTTPNFLPQTKALLDILIKVELKRANKAARGKPKRGRPSNQTIHSMAHRLKGRGLGATEISKSLGISRAHVYRILAG